MRKTTYTAKNKKVRPMTRIPGWMLTVRGYVESFRGECVCDRYIERLYDKMNNQIKDEEILAENELVLLRQEAEDGVVRFQKYQKTLEDNVALKEDSPEAIRENRRKAKTVKDTKEKLTKLMKKLIDIDEKIPHVKTIRDDRIDKITYLGTEKIRAYVSGVNYGQLKEYEYKPQTKKAENHSRAIYREKHEALEKQVQMIISGKEA